MELLPIFDLIGTIAFAISGASVGIHKKMDIFGVNMLAVTTGREIRLPKLKERALAGEV